MSFPGYLKSLKLRDISNNETEEPTDELMRLSKGAKIHASRKRNIENGGTAYTSQELGTDELIVDERGNGPKRSLWVGNIPPRTTSSELRELFRRFGKIESTKPHAKYAFVNFETLDSAIAAFKKYHDQDIFRTGNSTINIRFTTNIAESKQAKTEVKEQKSSISLKAEAAQKYWFQTAARPSNEPVIKTPVTESWPNGLPPTGPKSQWQDISPPPLRRGDSYRPAELTRGESYRSDELRRPSRDKFDRRRSSYRHSDQHYSPSPSPKYSRSPSRSISSRVESRTPSPRSGRIRGDDSPLPWERKRTKLQSSGSDLRVPTDATKGVDDTFMDIDQSFGLAASVQTQRTESEQRPANIGSDNVSYVEPLPEAFTGSEVGSSSAFSLQPGKPLRSPALRPLGHLFAEEGNLRASSAPSEAATSSTKTSSRKRRCHDCKKPGSDLSMLVPCSQCKRRFHTGCGDPRPSICVNLSDYVCGGCLRSKRNDPGGDHATCETMLPTKLKEKAHLVSPPLSFSQDGNASINLSPSNNLALSFFDESGPPNLFRTEPVASDAPPNPVRYCSPPSLHDKEEGDVRLTFSIQSQRRCSPTNPLLSPKQFSNENNLAVLMNKYKVVTCKWWASGSCTQPEEGCYYAHCHTPINLPDRKRINKYWTCFDWLQGKCLLREQDCLHAHEDTGLHIWRDGRPSFKHVTCYWWLKGRCKWAQDSCKLAHKDTGFYSLDPSETWQGGAKFSTTRPALDGPPRPFLTRRGTGTIVSASNSQPGNELTAPKSSMPDSSITSTIGSAGSHIPTKPALTINTSARLPSSDRSQLFARNRPFSISIGGPPETPNEDSPEKQNNNGYGASANKFHFIKEPDLPTPGLDEYQVFENSLLDNTKSDVQIPGNNNNSSNQKKAEIGRQIAELEKEAYIVANTLDEKVRRRQARMDASTHESDGLSKPIMDEMKSDASRDPRLQRQSKPSEQSFSTNIEGDSLVVPETSASVEERSIMKITTATTATTTNQNLGDDSTRRGVRKCQMCQKIVFGSDLCRICSSKKDIVTTVKSHENTERVDLTNSPEAIPDPVVSRVTDVLANDLKPTNAPKMIVPDLKNPLKRSASGSNMFLKNKRPKNLMMFSTSGSIRPDAFSRQSLNKRPRPSIVSLEVRREAQPTLDDLIMKERMKNNKRKESTVLDDTKPQSIARGKVDDAVDSRSNSTAVQDMPPDLPTEDKDNHPAVTPTTQIVESGDIFGSPRSSPGIPLAEVRANCNPQVTRVVNEGSRSTRSPQRPSREISQWRNSESPEPRATGTESPTSKGTISRKDTSSRTSVVSEVRLDPETRMRPKPLSLQRTSSRDIVISPEKFSWASTMTCTHCQKSHKKCLHDDGGVLSAVKCREYVLSRKGKPDTGRPRYEWNAIIAASELEPESESETDSSEDEITDDLVAMCSSESDDDFLTAIGGDDIDQPEVFVNNSKKSPTKMAPPPTSSATSPTVLKFAKNNSYSNYVASNRLQPEQVPRKHGLMFESESEEDDYLSDNYEAPIQLKRTNDPLFVPPKYSRDLFEISPHLNREVIERKEMMILNRPPRQSRKEQWANLKARQLQERRELFGNPHWEIDRVCADITVSALVERILPPKDSEDRFAVPTRQHKEEDMTFCDFLGAPKLPEICLMADEERLGFRDGQKERDRTFGRTGRGLGKRETDDEKWPIRPK